MSEKELQKALIELTTNLNSTNLFLQGNDQIISLYKLDNRDKGALFSLRSNQAKALKFLSNLLNERRFRNVVKFFPLTFSLLNPPLQSVIWNFYLKVNSTKGFLPPLVEAIAFGEILRHNYDFLFNGKAKDLPYEVLTYEFYKNKVTAATPEKLETIEMESEEIGEFCFSLSSSAFLEKFYYLSSFLENSIKQDLPVLNEQFILIFKSLPENKVKTIQVSVKLAVLILEGQKKCSISQLIAPYVSENRKSILSYFYFLYINGVIQIFSNKIKRIL